MKKKILFARICMLVICAVITISSYWKLNQSYDPLARYPYGNAQQRELILNKLDNKEIDYLISQHIKPKVFIDFINVKGFDVYHCQEYAVAKETQEQSNDYIVNFVNKYTKYFNTDSLEELLTYYSYLDLTTFYENELINNENLSLVSDPSQSYLLLDKNKSIYRYEPQNLINLNGVLLHSDLEKDLNDMQNSYSSMMNGQTMTVYSAYKSYDEMNELFTGLSGQYGEENVSKFLLKAGQDESQLGYTISLFDVKEWICLCLDSEKTDNDFDYNTIIQSLSDDQREMIVWLEENAYRFGFVVRYPYDKRDKTGHEYQPFLLRYVGKDAAKKMHSDNLCMEEMDFDDFEE